MEEIVKSVLKCFVFVFFFVGQATLANDALFNAKCAGCSNFVAPTVVGAENVNAPDVGSIVYDASYEDFRGYKADGSWTKFWSGSNTIRPVSSTTTLTSSDDVVIADASSGALTLTLPSAASNTGKVLTLKKSGSDSTFNQVSISGTVDGLTTRKLSTQGESITIVSDGTSWQIINRRIPSDWHSYTPTLTGFGTTSSEVFAWRRVGNNIEISGKFTAGTTTATEARATLPSGLTSDSSLPAIHAVGHWWNGNPIVGPGAVLIETSSSYVVFGSGSSGNNSYLKINGSAMFNTATTPTGFFASFPVSGWEG